MASTDYKKAKENASRYTKIHREFQDMLLIVEKMVVAHHKAKINVGKKSFWGADKEQKYKNESVRHFENFFGSVKCLIFHILCEPDIYLSSNIELDKSIILRHVLNHYETIKTIYPNWHHEYAFIDDAFYGKDHGVIKDVIERVLRDCYKYPEHEEQQS